MSVSQIGLIFLGVGGLMALIALIFFFRTRRFLESAVPAQGVVTGLVASSGGEGGTVYKPVVQFTTADGQTAGFTGNVGSNPPRYSVGQTVKVLYSPTNPSDARIPGFFGMWFVPVFLGIFGAAFLGVGIFLALFGSDSTISTASSSPPPNLPGVAGSPPPDGDIPVDLPSIPPVGAPLLVVQTEAGGIPQPLPVTCDSIRDAGKAREVRLSFQGGTLTFKAKPFTGPGAYTGSNLEVGGSIFDGGQPPTGAVVFDESGSSGAVNLVAGDKLASGTWDCSGT
ncbi:MAG: DUF3592 domain-containing protein [Actinomycetota bacterium]